MTRNQNLPETIDSIFTLTKIPTNDKVELTSEQIEMLLMSDEDIKFNRIISQENLDKSDNKWLSLRLF